MTPCKLSLIARTPRVVLEAIELCAGTTTLEGGAQVVLWAIVLELEPSECAVLRFARLNMEVRLSVPPAVVAVWRKR